MVEMISLSIQISDIMSYNIKIAKEITAETFPEVMKRLRAIQSMLPKEVILKEDEVILKEDEDEEFDKDEITQKKKDYYQRNKEQQRAYASKYYAEHKDEINIRAKMKKMKDKDY